MINNDFGRRPIEADQNCMRGGSMLNSHKAASGIGMREGALPVTEQGPAGSSSKCADTLLAKQTSAKPSQA